MNQTKTQQSVPVAASNRIVFLDWLRVIACLMVMIVHASECIYSNDYSFSFPTETDRWSTCLIIGFVRPAVPLFLIASAYLLVPLRTDTQTFFKKRFLRVCIPFIVWLLLYAFLPALWGEFSFAEAKQNLAQVFINFIPRESHLWFIYMLLGIYLIMPVLSPWLERVSRKEEKWFLVIWLFTTLFWHAHERFGNIFGECWWNPYPVFYYVSGYVGYVVMAHYIRKYLDWSLRKTLYIAGPCFLIGYLFCIYSFYTRSFNVETVRELELSWQTTSIAPVIMSFSAFMLIKKINITHAGINKVIRNISDMSYGMYLMHMMMLPFIFKLCYSLFFPPVAILATALLTYLASFIITRIISCFKFGKYIVG